MAKDKLLLPVLDVFFFRSETGVEPVRVWLKSLDKKERRIIGEDVKTVQLGWPIGMPVVRKLEPSLWEVRSKLSAGIARIIFTIIGNQMILLHGFIKKSQKMPAKELQTARNRKRLLEKEYAK